MTIKVGDSIPKHEFQILAENGMNTKSSEFLFVGKKVVLFAVPGAFTPTCSESHLPGYVAMVDKLKAKGVDAVYCLSVNDAFVMASWGRSQNAELLTMLADGDASFTKALGLEMETGAFGGLRCQRFAMIVDNGVVQHLAVEAPKAFEVSDAQSIFDQL